MPVATQRHRDNPDRPRSAFLEVAAAAVIVVVLIAVLAMMVFYRPG